MENLSILLDTDVLSAFAKIRELKLISDLFPDDEILIPDGVYEELMHIKELGYGFVDDIFNFVKDAPMIQDELEAYHSFLSSTNLGKGELQCIAICVLRNYPFITNDKKAKNFAREKNVKAWDIPDILKALWKTKIKTKDEVAVLMDMLEQKDRMVIKDKNRIFG